MKIFKITFLFFFISSCKTSVNEVNIGNQIWLKNNLDVIEFNNGDKIQEANDLMKWEYCGIHQIPAWCYVDSNSNTNSVYGKLYNWYAVNDKRGLAPKGWRIPTKNDFEILINYLGGEDIAGSKLKSINGWADSKNINDYGTNISGFNALPSGARYGGILFGGYSASTYNCFFWTLTQKNKDSAYYAPLDFQWPGCYVTESTKSWGLSVRCVKN